MRLKKISKLLIMIIIVFLCSFLVSFLLINSYKKSLLNNTNNLVNKIIETHPEFEEEVIKIVTDKQNRFETSILKKYGINVINQTDLANYKNKVIVINTIFVGIILIIFIIIYYKQIRVSSNHRQLLTEYINAILNDDFNFSFKDYEETEESKEINNIYQLTNKLNQQKDNLFKEKQILENFLSDISHQIKTPLTSLTVINELLLNENISQIDKRKFLSKSNAQLARIDWLVTSLLKLAKMDNKSIVFKQEDVNLANLFQVIQKELALNFELKNQIMVINGNQESIIGDYNWLKEAFYNIVKNASDYGNEDSTIEINLSDNPIYTEILIVNQGTTISQKDLRNIFKRFYKGALSNPSSVGIGLNMAKNILENNKGTIKVYSKSNQTTFEIRIYKNIK